MNFKKIWSMFKARNHEFFRDRAAFGWNFLFPFLLIGGFAIMFGGESRGDYKLGLFPLPAAAPAPLTEALPAGLKSLQHVELVGFSDGQQALAKLRHHKIDLLLELGVEPPRYWVNDSSPKGYYMEKIVLGTLAVAAGHRLAVREAVKGVQIRYIDWLFPGILAMNMMFSALYGVGYVVVRYRKMGVLKRLKATPLTAFEYLTAQMLSRIFLLTFSLVILWVGCDLIFSFHVQGSYVDIFVVFFMGGLSLTSLGLILAARGVSEEFTNGMLNFITWPMMFLSEVWFSIEGAPHWVKLIAKIFPLTHVLEAVRRIMNDGAGLGEVSVEITVLGVMTLLFLTIGAALFSWTK
jgi:ABC-2 type transport system permease protein